jgi:hypothetical protein
MGVLSANSAKWFCLFDLSLLKQKVHEDDILPWCSRLNITSLQRDAITPNSALTMFQPYIIFFRKCVTGRLFAVSIV